VIPLPTPVLLPFLCVGVMLPIFQLMGNQLLSSDFWKMTQSSGDIEAAVALSTRGWSACGPFALLTFSVSHFFPLYQL